MMADARWHQNQRYRAPLNAGVFLWSSHIRGRLSSRRVTIDVWPLRRIDLCTGLTRDVGLAQPHPQPLAVKTAIENAFVLQPDKFCIQLGP